MKMVSNNLTMMAGAAAVGLALIWWATRAGNAAKLAQGTVRVAGEAATGVVKGAAELVGIPDTSLTQCQKDLADGNLWDASFSCPTSDYLAGVFGSTAVSSSERASSELTEQQIDEFLQNSAQAQESYTFP